MDFKALKMYGYDAESSVYTHTENYTFAPFMQICYTYMYTHQIVHVGSSIYFGGCCREGFGGTVPDNMYTATKNLSHFR